MDFVTDSNKLSAFGRKLKGKFSSSPKNSSTNSPSPTPANTPTSSSATPVMNAESIVADIETGPHDLGGQPGSTSRPAPISGPKSQSAKSDTWFNAVKLTLEIFETTLGSVPVPGLKGAIGGVLKIIDQFDKTDQNRKELEELGKYVNRLKDLLSPSSGPISEEVTHRIETAFAQLKDVNSEVERVLNHRKFRRIIDASSDTDLIVTLFRQVKFLIEQLTVGAVLHTEAIAWTNLQYAERAILNELHRAKAAQWDDVDFDECLEETRTTVLKDIKTWIRSEDVQRIHWLNGLAGTGKSTLAKSIAHYAADQGQLGASFFCSRDEKDRSDVKSIFPTLAFQLAKLFPKFRAELIRVIQDRGDYTLPSTQLQKLIVEPLKTTGLHTQPIVIVIDALDECKDEKTSSTILMALSKYIGEVPFLKIFVTSRPEPAVRDAFRLLRERSNVLDLHLVDSELVNNDIRRFLTVRLAELTKDRSNDNLPVAWPPVELVERLVQKAGGSFIFASTAFKFINPDGDLEEQLEKIAELPTHNEGRFGIDDLYRKVFESAIARFSDEEVSECRLILGSIIFLQNPLSLTELSQLLCLTRGHVAERLMGFHSVLAIPREDKTGVIRIIHASFHDFLTDKTRCLDPRLLVHGASQHQEIALCLFRCMMKGLQRDRYSINQFRSNGGSFAYADHHWADHLQSASQDRRKNEQLVVALEEFVRTEALYWFEMHSLLESMDIAVTTFQKASSWYSGISQPCPKLMGLFSDTLAAALYKQSDLTGQLGDLDDAIALHHKALKLLPAPHPDRLNSLNNLGSALVMRFNHTSKIEDVDEAITLHQEALSLQPASHPDRPRLLHNFAFALQKHFSHQRLLLDLEEAIIICQESLDMLPQDHPHNCMVSITLGNQLMNMYYHTQHSGHLDNAMATFRAAVTCQSAPASERLTAAQYWAHHADDGNHDSALEAYQHVMELLLCLAMLGLDLQWHQQVLKWGDVLVRNAAACAIQYGQVDRAVEFIEEGQNMFYSQALQLHKPLDRLSLVAPNLTQKLWDSSHALEQGAFQNVSINLPDTQQRLSLEQETAHYCCLSRDWFLALEEVRRLDGFEDFLGPKPLVKLQKAAAMGPVVILNASESGCAALVITLSSVQHVPLPKFTMKVARMLVDQIQHASSAVSVARSQLKTLMQQTGIPSRPSYQYDRQRGNLPVVRNLNPDDIFRRVLATLWTLVAEPVVHCLALTKSESPPRMWWYPTGPFTSLPIHAAGIYGVEDGERLSNYAVSSYTPTLNALLAPLPLATNPLKMLAVIQPNTPGYAPLPSTYLELLKIEEHIPCHYLVKLGIPEAPATVEKVISHLATVSIIHLACHGVQDTKSPLESALILDGGQKLKVSQIMEQPIPNALLAFLSGCETAMSSSRAIHPAASLLFAGFRGVVGTMWSMADRDGPMIADSFYGNLFQSNVPTTTDAPHPNPDTMQTALALQLAVAKLRDAGSPFRNWTTFIHLGL